MKSTADTNLQRDVQHELRWEPGVDAANIGVIASEGSVTLTGHVPSYSAKMRAVRAAERVHAVRAVADELEVRLADSDSYDDSDIARAIAHSLRWTVDVPTSIEAEVRNGWVTLRGSARTAFQRHAAQRVVASQRGVRGVTNNVVITEQARPDEVRRAITAALHRNAQLEAARIEVTTERDTVHLHGRVHSLSEARAATAAAYAAPGVRNVDNELVVTP